MPLRGELSLPGDRSLSHRVVLVSILAKGEMSINGLPKCPALQNSIDFFKSLGGETTGGAPQLNIKGLCGDLPARKNPDETMLLDCGHSSTTMRLGSGILAGLPGDYILDGDLRLRQQPMERLAEPLRQMGALVKPTNGRSPMSIRGGNLHGIEYVNTAARDQIKGAVILAGISAKVPVTIIEQNPTREHTENIVQAMGGGISHVGTLIQVTPRQLSLPETMDIPGDTSFAAFFLIGAAIIPDSLVTAKNVLLSTTRLGFLKILDRMGAEVSISLSQEKPFPTGSATVEYAGPLMSTEITPNEIALIIEEIPMLILAATTAQGVTIFRRVKELKLQDSDRLAAIQHQLSALGAKIWMEDDDLYVKGPTKTLLPDHLDSGGDHYMAITMHLAAIATGTKIPVAGDDCIPFFYPSFKDELANLCS